MERWDHMVLVDERNENEEKLIKFARSNNMKIAYVLFDKEEKLKNGPGCTRIQRKQIINHLLINSVSFFASRGFFTDPQPQDISMSKRVIFFQFLFNFYNAFTLYCIILLNTISMLKNIITSFSISESKCKTNEIELIF